MAEGIFKILFCGIWERRVARRENSKIYCCSIKIWAMSVSLSWYSNVYDQDGLTRSINLQNMNVQKLISLFDKPWRKIELF